MIWFVQLIVVVLSGVLSGCLQTRSQIQQQEERKIIQEQVKNLQLGRADSQNRMQEISNEVLQLNGRIEALEAKLNSLDRGFQMHNRQGDQQISEVSERVKTIEEALLGLNQRMDALVQELQTLRQNEGSSNKSAKSAVTPSKGPERGPFTSAEDDYNKGNWGEAILNYMKYREQNPTGKRYAEATYKIGYSFQQMGKAAQAKSFYQEVINRFPGTPHAKKAQIQLQKIDK